MTKEKPILCHNPELYLCKLKCYAKQKNPHSPSLKILCCFVSAITIALLSKCRIKGVRAWSQVRGGRGRGSLYRAWPVQCPGDQICCGHGAECYPLPNLSGLLRGWSSNLVTPVVLPVVITLQHLMYYA